jgi:signal transduction histidine kinase
MKSGHKNYLTNLLGFSTDNNKKEETISEEKMQKEFDQFKYEKQIVKSKSFTYFVCVPMIILAGLSIYTNHKPIRPTYFLFVGISIDFLLYLVSKKYESSLTRMKWFRNIRFFLLFLNVSINWIFPVNPVEGNIIRYTYCGIFYLNFLYNYFIEFNYIILIFIAVLNSVFLLSIQYSRNLGNWYLVPEVIINLVYYYAFSLLKKSELQFEKLSFIESYKNNNYINYIQNLVNVLNTMIISIANEDILFINDYALNYFTNNRHLKNPVLTYNTENRLNNEQHINLNEDDKEIYSGLYNQIRRFLELLLLNSSNNDNYNKGEKFYEIVRKFSSENKLDSVNFIKLGYFTHDKIKDLYFEIHARKLKYQKEALELLIYDISEIKIAEKQSIETKYKHKILAKIAHEFKTPLITIISLIEKIFFDQESLDLDKKTRKNLYYVTNLSNYTLSLISDIIHYVSEYVNLRINKNEVNLYEVMDFTNNVLKTLVECNENKSNKIKTKMHIDSTLFNIKLHTDENRLKQILLNFISNSFKFTQQGFINLKAKYLMEQNLVEISVKDSGIGIKNEDHDLIFKENVQLNVDHEYNSQGSGLGLSIVKNMANILNYKLGFKSVYGKGSKFYVRIDFKNPFQLSKVKTISYNENDSLSKIILNHELNTPRSINYGNLKKNMIKSRLDNSDTNLLNQNKFIEIETNRTQLIKLKLENNIESTQIPNYDEKKDITSFCFCLGLSKQLSVDSIKLVVVDDHKLVRDYTLNILKNLLKNFNSSLYEIVECSDGIELLNIVRLDTGNQINLILTD